MCKPVEWQQIQKVQANDSIKFLGLGEKVSEVFVVNFQTFIGIFKLIEILGLYIHVDKKLFEAS